LEAQRQAGGRLTDRQLRDEMVTLLLAGHETTALALSYTFYLLARHPEAEARLDRTGDSETSVIEGANAGLRQTL